jgi:hypothetical protein
MLAFTPAKPPQREFCTFPKPAQRAFWMSPKQLVTEFEMMEICELICWYLKPSLMCSELLGEG